MVTGDITQIGLPRGQKERARAAREVLKQVRGIAFIQFDTEDVVRTPGAAYRQCLSNYTLRTAGPGRRRGKA